MERQKKNCIQCGVPTDIIPPGVSKKTGKPYGAFAKCKECGFAEQIGQKPSGRSSKGSDEVISILKENNSILKEIHKLLMSEAPTKAEEDIGSPF